MNWSVIWLKSARRELGRAYLKSRIDGCDLDFANAIDRIDARLARNPTGIGESRSEAERIYFDLPVTVQYKLQASKRVVLVCDVRYARSRGTRPPGSDDNS